MAARRLLVELARAIEPRRFALWTAAAVATLLTLAALADAGLPLDAFELDVGLTIPRIIGASLLGAAAWLGAVAGRPALATALAAIAVDELGAAHERVGDGAVAAAVLVGLLAAVLAARAPPAWLGAALWAASQLLDDSERAFLLRGAAELVGAALCALGMLVALRRAMGAAPPPRPAHSVAVELALGLKRRALAILVAVCIAALTALGVLVHFAGLDVHAFDMNAEQTVPALFSALLLLGVAGLAYLLRDEQKAAWTVLAVFFAFLALDEAAVLHEQLQGKLDVPGQLGLLPLIVVAAVAWLRTLPRVWEARPAGVLYVAGVASWIASQAGDFVHRADESEPPAIMIVLEELLEMGGSALIGWALLEVLRARSAAAAPPAPRAWRTAPRSASGHAS